MKILILCNIIIPKVSEHLLRMPLNIGGWIEGMLNRLLESVDMNVTVVSPDFVSKELIRGEVDNLRFYLFPSGKDSSEQQKYFTDILRETEPDVVHIFGTEYSHTLSMVKTCESIGIAERVIINIQGMPSVYAKHYCAALSDNIINSRTLKEWRYNNNIKAQKKDFEKRGLFEIEALRRVKHVIGRTDWDKACTSQINPLARYHFCNETLRNEFYNHSWDIEKCERNSIFISQAGYPIKGLHFVLEALPEIIKRFPDTRLYIAGDDITKTDTFVSRIKISSYGVYIKRLIKKYKLENHITFTGPLNEKEMCGRFLKSHIFVSASSIENSPNSLGEAMILGVPCVSSYVGGVQSLMMHNEEGCLYQFDAPYMLSYYTCNIFADDELALKFSANAKKHAVITHDRDKNLNRILEIYKEIEFRGI